jgi:CheY-like chemotaxis protein
MTQADSNAVDAARKAVLVVEDDPDMRQLVEEILSDEGYRVNTAQDGQAALEEVARELPGLILLDMRMPRMNGWEFAREFRERYGRRAPIVVLTAAADAGERAAEIGAEGFLGKPFELDELLRTVERFLSGEPA